LPVSSDRFTLNTHVHARMSESRHQVAVSFKTPPRSRARISRDHAAFSRVPPLRPLER
jgi:hypothetical protein